ncbi:hypothetical protein SAMN04488122_4749 [Chitinophaga arvensicola]|uniref:Uncharacterized protein n=2 Tax=Chitinophaga arvensicola TaxID=29529 RepID=A0A1I0S8L6_9BACT|nr:hypothetical protein SAMN04488122_4749 [Chitinophaga arvensicola]
MPNPLSRTAYLVSAWITFFYLLTLVFKIVVFLVYPVGEESRQHFLFQGGYPAYQLATCLTLIFLIAMLYPLLVICMYNYPISPIASIAAFLALFLAFSVQLGLQSVYLLRMQIELPNVMSTMDGPHVQENVLLELYQFLQLQRYLSLPVALLQMVAGIILAITLSSEPAINFLVKTAFGILVFHQVIYLTALHRSLHWVEYPSKVPYLFFEAIVCVLLLIWFIYGVFKTKETGHPTSPSL